jgi:hypothetical protein
MAFGPGIAQPDPAQPKLGSDSGLDEGIPGLDMGMKVKPEIAR